MAKYISNLKEFRIKADLTQEELASIVGVCRETIGRLENAQYNPSLKLAIDISNVVQVPIQKLFIFYNE